MTDTTEFLDETEVCERSLRRLADSRSCFLTKDGNQYQIIGAGIVGITLSDDECWDVLSALPQTHTLGGKGVRLKA